MECFGIGMLAVAWVCSGLGLSKIVSYKFSTDCSQQIILRSDIKAIEDRKFFHGNKKFLKIKKKSGIPKPNHYSTMSWGISVENLSKIGAFGFKISRKNPRFPQK